MNDQKPHQPAIRAAEKLKEEFSVSQRTQYDDEDRYVAPEAIALIITREYEPVVSALKPFVKFYERLSGRKHVPTEGIWYGLDVGTDSEALITIEDFKRAVEALNQLTKEIKTPPSQPSL